MKKRPDPTWKAAPHSKFCSCGKCERAIKLAKKACEVVADELALARINAGPLPAHTAPTCAEWCGSSDRFNGGGTSGAFIDTDETMFCTAACLAAGHPLNPVPR